jgi:hypothetical protein
MIAREARVHVCAAGTRRAAAVRAAPAASLARSPALHFDARGTR